MSQSTICHGCGQLVEIPAGYRRNKIQCPACGVISPVTADASASRRGRSEEAPPKRKEEPAFDDERWAAEFLSTPEPPAPVPEPIEEEPPPPPPTEELAPIAPRRQKRRQVPEADKPAFEMKFPCRRCGHMVVRQGECPFCDAPPPASGEQAIPQLSLDRPVDEEEESTPYALDGDNDVPCPKCTNMLPPGSVVCTRCGWHLRRRKKLVKTYQPLARSWETNYSLQTRRTIWGGLQFLAFMGGLAANLAMDNGWVSFVFSLIGFAVMTSFLLGTFDRLDLVRDEKGKVTLTKTRRVCFFTAVTLPIEVRGHSEIVTGRTHEVTFWEWLVFFFLLPGVIPALVWWYYVIHKITFQAALARDHGYPTAILYQGWDEGQMRDIAVTLSGAAGLPLDGA